MTFSASTAQPSVFTTATASPSQPALVHSVVPAPPLQVYEHVYQTVDVTGSPEVRATATAKVLIVSKNSNVLWQCLSSAHGTTVTCSPPTVHGPVAPVGVP